MEKQVTMKRGTPLSLAHSPTIGDRIKDRMCILGMDGRDVARAMGCHEASVSRWVMGKSIPYMRTLRLLAGALKCDVSELTGTSDEKPIQEFKPLIGLPALIQVILEDHMMELIRVASEMGLEITVRGK